MTPGPDRHWFVAVNEVNVGPIDIAEIEARWRTGELGGDSLAWRPGMSEWLSIALIPELAYLNQLEQAPREPDLAEVQGVIGDASNLSDLVALELEAAESPAATSTATATTPSPISEEQEMGLPDLGNLGSTNSQRQPRQHHWNTGWDLRAITQPKIPPGPAPWTEARLHPGKRNSRLLLTGGGFFLLSLGLALVIIELVRGSQPIVPEAPPAITTPAPSLPPVASLALQPVAQTPEPKSPAPVPAPAPRPKPSAIERTVQAPTTRAPEPTPAPQPPQRVTPKPPPDPPPLPGLEPRRLTKKDILRGIKRNARNLLPCLRAARAKEEVTAGRIRLVLDWVIEADGSVSRPKLKGPATMLRTSIPRCVSAQMRAWTFPEAGRSSKVRNFGLPINLK